MYNQRIPTIKHWVEQDRPREKFIIETGVNLSNAELIAILIGSGNREESAVDLAGRILESIDGDLDQLARLSIQDLSRFKGIGLAKAVSIAAAVELCYKRMPNPQQSKVDLGSIPAIYAFLDTELAKITDGSCWLFLFSATGVLIHRHLLAQEGKVFADPRLLLEIALEHRASCLIPVQRLAAFGEISDEDILFTKSLSESAGMLGIAIIDRFLLYPGGYLSFKESGIL